MGGAVSAEHGVGKIKRDFLEIMYGEDAIAQMARLKLAFDPAAQLGRGNLMPASLLPGVGGGLPCHDKGSARCADDSACSPADGSAGEPADDSACAPVAREVRP